MTPKHPRTLLANCEPLAVAKPSHHSRKSATRLEVELEVLTYVSTTAHLPHQLPRDGSFPVPVTLRTACASRNGSGK